MNANGIPEMCRPFFLTDYSRTFHQIHVDVLQRVPTSARCGFRLSCLCGVQKLSKIFVAY